MIQIKRGHRGRDETVEAKRGRDKAKQGFGGLNKAIEAGIRPLRPNEAM